MDEQLTEPIGMSSPIARRVFVMWGLGLLAVVAAAGVLVQAAATSDGGPPEPTAAMLDEMRMVDDYEADGDCRAIAGHLRVALAQLGTPGTDAHLRVATLVRYAEDAQGRIGCDIVADLAPDPGGPLAGSSRSAAH